MAKTIGIYGKMHTGKTTLAKNLLDVDIPFTRRLSFANNVKKVVSLLGLPEERETYQKLGQGLRNIWPDVWVNAIFDNKDADLDLSTYGDHWTMVIDDMRYMNEFEKLRTTGKVIKLVASDDTRWERFLTSDKFDPNTTREQWDAYQGHQSETDLDNIPDRSWDLVIQTDNMDAAEVMSMVGTATELWEGTYEHRYMDS